MAQQLTAADARQSLTGHVEQKGIDVFTQYGPTLGWDQLQLLLADRACVRYPVEIVFDATPFQPGEFAHPAQQGATPEEGFTMFVHPAFESRPDLVVAAVLYQLVVVNYGDFAAADEAETFGAACLGLTRDEYYGQLCAMADEIGGPVEYVETEPHHHHHEPVLAGFGQASGGCSCGGSGGGCGGH